MGSATAFQTQLASTITPNHIPKPTLVTIPRKLHPIPFAMLPSS